MFIPLQYPLEGSILDLPLETALGYFYSDMFNRWAGPGA